MISELIYFEDFHLTLPKVTAVLNVAIRIWYKLILRLLRRRGDLTVDQDFLPRLDVRLVPLVL